MSKPKRAVVEYMGREIRLGVDGLYCIDIGDAHHAGLNLVAAKSIVLAEVHRERHRAKWGAASDYERVYLYDGSRSRSEVRKAHWLKNGLWSTICGEGPRQDWLRCLPIDLGSCTMCKSCTSIFQKRVF